MKKFLSLTLALVLTLALAVPAFAVGGFSDVPSTHWAYNDIMACAKLRIVTGFDDGSFKPGDEVTGVQFIVMMTRTFQAGRLDSVVTPADQPWYYANIKVAGDVGLSYGLTIDENPMSRYDMALALYNELCIIDSHKIALGKQSIFDSADTLAAKTALKDWDNMTLKQKTWVKYCYALGILSGMSDGTFSGESNMTRAQACAVIIRMMNLINGSTPAVPAQPTTPTQPEQPQQPEPPAETSNPDVSSITIEYALEVIAGFKQQYPAGTVWDGKGTNGNKYGAGLNSTDVKACFNQFRNADGRGPGTSTTYACGAWVAMVSDAIFGQSGYPAREVTDPSKVRPGDLIIVLNSAGKLRHVRIVTSTASYREGYSGYDWWFSYSDGNVSDKVRWADDGRIYADEYDSIRVFTRYPD